MCLARASLFHGTEQTSFPGTISRNGLDLEWENQRSSLCLHIASRRCNTDSYAMACVGLAGLCGAS